VHAVGPKIGLALGIGDRLLQAAADAVGDFAHVLVLASVSISVFTNALKLFRSAGDRFTAGRNSEKYVVELV